MPLITENTLLQPLQLLNQLLDDHSIICQELEEKLAYHQGEKTKLRKIIELVQNTDIDINKPVNTTITREAVLDLMKQLNRGVKTAELVNKMFPTASKAQHKTLIRNMAVVLYLLERDKKITKRTPPKGTRGNLFFIK